MSEEKSTSKDVDTASSESASPPNQNLPVQGVFSVKKPQRYSRRFIIIVIAILAIGLAGVGIWWLLSQQSAPSKDHEALQNQPALATVCDTAVIQQASRPIGDNDIAALQSVADSILQKKNYRGDVNCNYILMRYYLMTGDVPNAKNTLDDLSDTHGRSGGYSTAFDPPAISPASLKEALEVMITNNQNEQKENNELNGLDG
jgi:hypothetical protein